MQPQGPNPHPIDPPPAPPILAVQHLTFVRPAEASARTILSDINFTLRPGEIAAVVGANGCGISTLLRLLPGYLWPTSGTIHLFGHAFGMSRVRDVRFTTKTPRITKDD